MLKFCFRLFKWNLSWVQCLGLPKFTNFRTQKRKRIWNWLQRRFGGNMQKRNFKWISQMPKSPVTDSCTATETAPKQTNMKWVFNSVLLICNVLFSRASNRHFIPPIVAKSVRQTNQEHVRDGSLTIWMRKPTHLRRSRSKSKSNNGVAVNHAGKNSATLMLNTKFWNNCTN